MGFYEFFKNHALQNGFQQNLRQNSLAECLDKILTFLQKSFWKKLFGKTPPLKGLYIYGSVGAGKTYIMDLFFQFFKGFKSRTHFKLFMLDLHKNGYKETIDSYKNIKLLCLDELEILDISDAMIVKKIFNELNQHGVFIITTSNISPQNLYKNGLHYDRFEPFIDYVIQNFQVFDLILKTDYRQYTKTHDLPENIGANDKILTIVLVDQTLEADIYHDGICINFNDFINHKFGTQHFYNLSKSWPVIYFKNVPHFDRTNTDLLRQFITLVDIYYDQQKKLRIKNKEALCFCEGINQPIKRLQSRIFQMNS
jgi:cell division protein ZapE